MSSLQPVGMAGMVQKWTKFEGHRRVVGLKAGAILAVRSEVRKRMKREGRYVGVVCWTGFVSSE